MAETMTVRIRDIWGQPREVELTDTGEFTTPGSILEQRLVQTAKPAMLIRKYVSRIAGQRNPRLYELLDHEIRAGTRLGQVYGGVCPPELPTLVGYDMDAEEPFALLLPYEGEPVVNHLSRLQSDDALRRTFQASLIRGLHRAGRAGVVHGAVLPRHVRWDGARVQLVDFDTARCADLRRPGGAAPPRLDVREDLAGAGMIIRHLTIGTSAIGSLADHARDPESLRALLEGVFAPVDQRPHAVELLRRMGADASLPETTDPERDLHAGWALFDSTTAPRTGPPPPPTGSARKFSRWLGLLILATLTFRGGPRR